MKRDLPMFIAATGFVCLVGLLLALYFVFDVPPPVE